MTIAEEIYRRARYLPNEVAREVLDFIGYLEQKYELPDDRVQPSTQDKRVGRSGHVRENPEDVVWNDLFFRQPPN